MAPRKAGHVVRTISEAARAAVIVEYSVSQSVTKAAAAAGVGRTSAHRALQAVGAIARPTPIYPVALAREAVRLHDEGLTQTAIAERLGGPSRAWVGEQVARAGRSRTQSETVELAQLVRHGRDYAPLRRRAKELRAKGWTLKRISIELGVCGHSVKRWLGLQGVPVEYHYWEAPTVEAAARRARRRRVMALWMAGRGTREIAQAVRASRSTVQNDLRAEGLLERRPRRAA
jgi:transposase